MPFISDAVLDAALNHVTANGDRVDICSQEPANFTEATSTFSLGNKAGASVGAPGDRTPNGRKVTVAAIGDGAVTGGGTATHWAVSKTTATAALLAANALASSQVVTAGNTFTLDAVDIGFPDAA